MQIFDFQSKFDLSLIKLLVTILDYELIFFFLNAQPCCFDRTLPVQYTLITYISACQRLLGRYYGLIHTFQFRAEMFNAVTLESALRQDAFLLFQIRHGFKLTSSLDVTGHLATKKVEIADSTRLFKNSSHIRRLPCQPAGTQHGLSQGQSLQLQRL